MSQETAQRITIWAWAARTMGVECDEHRISGLVEVTSVVPLADLKPALETVMRTEPNGFLPSPGAVIAAYRAASEHRARTRALPAPLEMSREDHLKWMHKFNPEGWDDRTWGAYVERMATDRAFELRARDAFKRRHEWVDEEMRLEIGRRPVSAAYRIRRRRELLQDAELTIRRPNPLDDGWIPSKEFDPISSIARSTSLRQSKNR